MIEEEQEAVVQGPGQILQEARKKAGLSTKDIADKLRLKMSVIEDIERDNYDINISLTFVRGYLKLYAKQVRVSEESVLAAFEKLNTQNKEPAKLQSFSRRIANQANDDKLMLVTYLILTVVIALVVIWWFQQSAPDSSNASVANTSAAATKQTQMQDESSESQNTIDSPIVEPLIAGDTQSSLAVQAPDDSVPQIALNEPDLIHQTAGATTSELSEPPSDVLEAVNELSDGEVELSAEAVQPVELIFEFSGDCWMNLSDASGENIAYGVKVKGRVMPVTGIPPFEVTLGAPEVVQIRYNGEPLDMSFLTPGRIAKFALPLSE